MRRMVIISIVMSNRQSFEHPLMLWWRIRAPGVEVCGPETFVLLAQELHRCFVLKRALVISARKVGRIWLLEVMLPTQRGRGPHHCQRHHLNCVCVRAQPNEGGGGRGFGQEGEM